MNFFEQQDRARLNSRRLVLLMALAVTALVALTSLVLSVAWQFMADTGKKQHTLHVAWNLLPGIALIILAVVVLGSLYKSLQLRDGGKAVAKRLGGRLINLQQHDADERKVLNVVEEMALASGTPVPPVYLIDDTSINAFAAGLTPQDAVIGITRGAICLLSREELQGVVAHEFSHIHNGDMRLNTRLVSVLHGILLIGLIGEFGMRSAKDGERAAIPLFLAGATLWVLGYTGTFFGGLIKAAVSREREYLADASAVQFTRNPASIGGALKKIGGYTEGSYLQASHAPEFSHLYFSSGVSAYVEGFMATHPPLKKRIRRIEPHWDGRFPQVVWPTAYSIIPDAPKVASAQAQGLHFTLADVEQSLASVGDPQSAHLAVARDALGRLAGPLGTAAHSLSGAQALIYGLLLSADPALRSRQLALISPTLDIALERVLSKLVEPLSQLDPDLRLPLLDLAIPALRQLEKGTARTFKDNMALLIKADGSVDLAEWTLFRIVQRSLDPPRPVQGKFNLEQLGDSLALLLGELARAGHADVTQAQAAFASACAELPPALQTLAFPQPAGLKAMEHALSRLNQLWPLQKPQLLKAMARCIEHDGRVTATEAELMRAVADILDCPLPPLASGAERGPMS
ncbi:M48 family metallopeptidase [Pseudomonas sp. NPDC090202]|uniref:M48 family metallopeptidase n=1 Tax=unclassified Pseudomonas TaxID=196821 RepID=UPI0038210A9A